MTETNKNDVPKGESMQNFDIPTYQRKGINLRKRTRGKMSLRDRLVEIALEWQQNYGVAPSITSSLSEYDAAMLVGCPETEYADCMKDKTAVSKGADFVYQNKRYQVKANRPSGRPGSDVTKVAEAKNYEWDYLIWIHYTTDYEIHEAWLWNVSDYKSQFGEAKRLSPDDMRRGKRLVWHLGA